MAVHFIVRGGKTNPVIIEARNGQGRLLPKLAGLKLKEIDRKTNRSEVLDLKIKRGADEFQLVRRGLPKKNDFVSGSPIYQQRRGQQMRSW